MSTVYDWSRDIFDDLSNSLNPITHSRVHDIEREANVVVEFSNSTPLFAWVREVVFGLKPSEKKTYTAFSGEWILGSPESLRIAFIQGVADGDGYASAIAQRVGLGSIMNARFIYRLLSTLNIQSYLRRKGVEIFHLNSLLKSESIQMFRNATDKKENLDEICRMIRARPRRKRVSPAEIKFMIRLAKKGLSPGRIAYQLWKKHGISRNIATVRRIVGENT